MKKVIMCCLFMIGLCVFCSQNSFAEYASLVGKRIEISGPKQWLHLGVALDAGTGDQLVLAHQEQDSRFLRVLLVSPDVLRIRNKSKGIVLDVDLFKKRAYVQLCTGVYSGLKGWIPVEWLDGNYRFPTMSETISVSLTGS